MDYKGQISAEYLLLVVVILIILSSVTIPLVGQSIDASNDVSWTSDAKIAVESIANAANVVYANGPGAKRTLNVYIPKTMTLTTGANFASLDVALTDGTTKITNATTQYPLETSSTTLNEGSHTVTVEWMVGSAYIDITVT